MEAMAIRKGWRLLEVTGDFMPGDRYGHGAVTLENGQILLIGQVSHSHLLSENRPLGGAAKIFVCFDLKMLLLLYLSCSFLFLVPFWSLYGLP